MMSSDVKKADTVKKRSKTTKDLKSCSANITATFNYFYRFIFLCYKQHGRLM